MLHGHHTVFPIPLAMAAGWNPELVQRAAETAALEAAADGINWIFAPMLDIARDPRWGRIIEGFGEDPYLASQFAAASVKGFQRQAGAGSPGMARVRKTLYRLWGFGRGEGLSLRRAVRQHPAFSLSASFQGSCHDWGSHCHGFL